MVHFVRLFIFIPKLGLNFSDRMWTIKFDYVNMDFVRLKRLKGFLASSKKSFCLNFGIRVKYLTRQEKNAKINKNSTRM